MRFTVKIITNQEIYIFQELCLMNSYTVKSRLGQGAFSTVYKVLRKEDNCQYAMKKIRIMSLSEKEVSNCLNEVRILASVEHPNIVSYKDSFFDELTNTFCLVTELVQGGDLSSIIMRSRATKTLMKEEFIWKIAHQVLEGLGALHDAKIMHRDIKSANIFLTHNHQIAKLGDMNVSIISNNGMAKTQTGTPYYASPEVWKQMPYNSKCDVWSLGCVLYQLAALRPPFEAKDLRSLKKNIISGVYKRIPKNYSQQLQSFIRCCLKVRPQQRSSVSQLLNSYALKKKCPGVKRQAQLEKSQASIKMIEKIQAPKKKQFKIIKHRLPPNRFSSSVSKIQKGLIANHSAVLEKENDKNLVNCNNSIEIKSNRILSKKTPQSNQTQTRIRSMSTRNNCCQNNHGNLPPLDKKKEVLHRYTPNQIPNIPKPKILRA